MANKYLIVLDLCTRAYAVEYTLLHIANSKEAGWKQAMDQFEAFNRKKYTELAEHQYYNVVGEINDTDVEIAVEKPCILWELKTY